MLTDMKLADFIEAVAAKTPTPGGGSVGAAVCSLGSALGIMAARFSQGPEALEAAGRLEGLKGELVPLVDEDARAYNLVSSAYGLPKGTEEEKKRRKEAIQNALREAAQVPLKVMMLALSSLEALAEFAPKCNKNLASDLAGAILMLSAGMETAAHNVRINAGGITEKEIRTRLEQEDKRLTTQGGELRQRLLRDVEKLGSEKK